MGELNNARPILDDYRDQTGTSRQHRFFLVFAMPLRIQFWDSSCVQVKGEDIRELLDTERTAGYRKTLQKSIRMFPVRIIDIVQDMLVRLIQ